jgi:hypothetical protein
MENYPKLTDEIVTTTYEEVIRNGLPFLQIFPQMFQDANIAETFKVKKSQRNKSITSSQLALRNRNIEEFREQIFLHCGMNLNIFKLPAQTQAAFWFMLFNWIECNNYSITIGPERRKVLANYYSRSNDPDSRAVQNIFRGLTKSGLLVKCKKSDLICKANKTYEVTYRVPFIVSQQTLNKNFIKLHKEIIQLKSELHQRSRKYLISKEYNVESKDIDKAVDDVLSSVIGKVSKRNIEALGRVNFSARIDFSVEGGLQIAEIENINSIEPSKTSDFYTQNELEPLLYKLRTAKQKQLLSSHFLDLKETYMVEGKTAFNKKFNSINGLGRSTKALLLSSFKEG